MFDGIREKVHSVQDNLPSSFRLLNVSTDVVPFMKKTNVKNIDIGSDILQKFLTQWNELHTVSEEIAHKAQVTDEKINTICNHTNMQLMHLTKLCYCVNLVPQLVNKTRDIVLQTKKLDSIFNDVENSLTCLEEIIQIQKVQEKQLESRFMLTMHKENRLRKLETLRENLERNYNEEVLKVEEKKSVLLRERQITFEEAFKQDLENYKQSGNLDVMNKSRLSTDPKVMNLEDVELDVDHSALDAMLTDA